MSVRYRHTQRGTLTLTVLIVAAAFCGFTAWYSPDSGRWPQLVLAVMFAVMAVHFSSLTVVVDGDELQWYFGPGPWTYKLPRGDIASVEIVRNKVSNGFGIRRRPGFRLYNVSGLDAVELRLKSGDIRRIGTDDAPGLAAALRSA